MKFNAILYIFSLSIVLGLNTFYPSMLKKTSINVCQEMINKSSEEKLALIDIRKGRYTDGIEIVKTLYEKLLDLDHHYASQSITQDIDVISNPLSYSEFNTHMDQIKNSVRSKKSVPIPQSLEQNPFISLGFTLVSSLFGNNDKQKRTEDITRVSCILDMTIQLHSDLKLIYHETEIMKSSCSRMLTECERLFTQVVETVDFETSIQDCRMNDGWEELNMNIEDYFTQRKEQARSYQTSQTSQLSDDIDIDFSINRITYFLENYGEFITASERQYEKFAGIIDRYEAHSLCSEDLPKEYDQLKNDIQSVAQKFKNAYRLSELKGSKLKYMLYGEK